MVAHKVMAVHYWKHDEADQSFALFRFLKPHVKNFEEIPDVSHPHHITVAKMGQNGAPILGKDVQMLARPL